MPSISLVSYNTPVFPALVDSGSTHCFIDKKFASELSVPTYSVSLISLWLFDGTSNFMIIQAVDLAVSFPSTGNVTPFSFYLAPLDSECKLVLGHNWLTFFNPLIDWVLGSQSDPNPSLMPSDIPPANSPGQPPLKAPLISLINTAAYMHACKLEGSVQFSLQLCPPPSDLAKAWATTTLDSPDLSNVPKEYHDFADVFSKAKASTLPPHCEHDLKIELEEGATLPLETLYLLSPVELEALWVFIDENLSTGFIQPTSSSHATLVLFIKKKDGSL
ncbi:hypothetical protein ID866_13011 [Astraeus odoratus]|nr:hypothetical protein ID866_13011 [Astraeus odoratus]